MRAILQYLLTRTFWINLLIYGALVLGGFAFLNNYLLQQTLHNEEIEVQDFREYHKSELENLFTELPFRYEIIDSLYDEKAKPGIVIDQIPEPGKMVKENRKIYLTINASEPPKIKLPDLRDRSKRQAMAILETYGLNLGNFHYVPSICVDCVIDVWKDSTVIEPGSLLEKGETLELVLGGGETNEFVPIPLLIDHNQEDALSMLRSRGLNPVVVHEDYDSPEDSINARIFMQFPEYDSLGSVRLGSQVKLFFTADYTKIPRFDVDSAGTNNLEP